mmetsp:Transcript_93884/g.265205  ORF Transcript_93884/g.265205 Transcript_93884/m.265205 type:complete len:344 (+) Transcript_93884:46-1077(+)
MVPRPGPCGLLAVYASAAPRKRRNWREHGVSGLRGRLAPITGVALVLLWLASRLPPLAAPTAAAAFADTSTTQRLPLRIALTREDGQNGKLRDLLLKRLDDLPPGAVDLVELPCIEHGPGPNLEELDVRLSSLAAGELPMDSVVLTSPEAARVFLQAWGRAAKERVGSPLPVPVACVGRGTSAVAQEAGMRVDFEPSVANAETLAAELPERLGPRVLYPASAQAQDTLQNGLRARGFVLERLNSYVTRGVQELGAEDVALMEEVAIATFGSPSAVKAWAHHCRRGQAVAACIGGTSRKAAETEGFARVLAPEQPGMEGWASVVVAAVRELLGHGDVGCAGANS